MNAYYKLLSPFAFFLGRFPKQILYLRFRKALKRAIQNPPQSFYDKVFWISCNTDTTQWTQLADKYLVREFVTKKCGEGLLTKLYGVYDISAQIDYDVLPDSFVAKTNNGCASNFLIRDKKTENLQEINKKLDFWIKFPYGDLTGQKHYARITPKIIIEELLFQKENPRASLIDYKFYCFAGKPMYCYVVSDRVFNTHIHHRMMYDMEWNALPSVFQENKALKEIDCPKTFSQMKDVVARLAEGFNFVRVDLYEVNGEIKFGEMTFMPGMDPGFTEEFLLHMGNMIKLD